MKTLKELNFIGNATYISYLEKELFLKILKREFNLNPDRSFWRILQYENNSYEGDLIGGKFVIEGNRCQLNKSISAKMWLWNIEGNVVEFGDKLEVTVDAKFDYFIEQVIGSIIIYTILFFCGLYWMLFLSILSLVFFSYSKILARKEFAKFIIEFNAKFDLEEIK